MLADDPAFSLAGRGRFLLAGYLLAGLLAAALQSLPGASFELVVLDDSETGFNSTEPRSPIGGNPGTTLGEQRRAVFEEAARVWGRYLQSAVPIRVEAEFTLLGGEPNAGFTLAGAAPVSVESNFEGAPKQDVWYPLALANSLAGVDLAPEQNDITIRINRSLDTDATLPNWYYGLDGRAPADQVDLLDVLLHELGHGLSFVTLTELETGRFFGAGVFSGGEPDVYALNLFDQQLNAFWTEMNSEERRLSARNDPYLVWRGPYTQQALPSILNPSSGGRALRAKLPGGGERTIGYIPAAFGPPLPAAGIIAPLALADDGSGFPRDVCQPIQNAAELAGNIAYVERGDCFFSDKVFAAQDAGARAVVIANNLPDAALVEMGFNNESERPESALTVPAIFISKEDGDALVAASPGVELRLGVPGDALSGTEAGRLRAHAPSAVSEGSSVSHWSTAASPDLLMEPFINDNLDDALDLTLTFMKDIGWRVIDIPYPHFSYRLWQEENFPPGAGMAALDADPDGDGLTNLEEYFFGGSPLVPDADRLPRFTVDPETRTVQFLRSQLPADLALSYEISTDLSQWQTAELGRDLELVDVSPLGGGSEAVRVRFMGTAAKAFLRLRIAVKD